MKVIVEKKEKTNGEKIAVVRKNGESPGRGSHQACIGVRVIKLHPTTNETQKHLDFQSKRKFK